MTSLGCNVKGTGVKNVWKMPVWRKGLMLSSAYRMIPLLNRCGAPALCIGERTLVSRSVLVPRGPCHTPAMRYRVVTSPL